MNDRKQVPSHPDRAEPSHSPSLPSFYLYMSLILDQQVVVAVVVSVVSLVASAR